MVRGRKNWGVIYHLQRILITASERLYVWPVTILAGAVCAGGVGFLVGYAEHAHKE